jgi:PhzF family phenazine biosynthesis protein
MTARSRAFRQIDVFTQQPYRGNALAVVLDGTGLSDGQMQDFASWTQLSETTFLLPPTEPQADYRLRIFTPGGELPFAGHPTLGSCHAWLQAGGQAHSAACVVQQCAVGLVRIRRETSGLAFAAPALQRSAVDASALRPVIAALGLQDRHVLASQTLMNGPTWLGLLLDSAETVRRLQPDHTRLRQLGTKVGVAARLSQGADLLVRAFAAPIGVPEDPVTGSLNASLAQWLMAEGLMPSSYQASQGGSIGRDGRVRLHRESDGQLWVGGDSVTCIRGEVWL